MANGQGTVVPPGGSISQTAAVALPVTGAAVVMNWLVAPSWPPPSDVMLIIIGVCSPAFHLIGRAIYHKLEGWTGEDGDGGGVGQGPQQAVSGGASTARAATPSPSATAAATPSTVVPATAALPTGPVLPGQTP